MTNNRKQCLADDSAFPIDITCLVSITRFRYLVDTSVNLLIHMFILDLVCNNLEVRYIVDFVIIIFVQLKGAYDTGTRE